jgi:Double zinc ribbon
VVDGGEGVDCPRCGTANPDDLLFCQKCNAFLLDGVPEPEPPTFQPAAEGLVRCRACGAESALGTVFCPTCGKLLYDSAATDEGQCIGSRVAPRSGGVATSGPGKQPEEPQPRRCPACGGPVRPHQAQCSRCGARATAMARPEDRALVPDTDSGEGDDRSAWNSAMRGCNRIGTVLEIVTFLRSLFSK